MILYENVLLIPPNSNPRNSRNGTILVEVSFYYSLDKKSGRKSNSV